MNLATFSVGEFKKWFVNGDERWIAEGRGGGGGMNNEHTSIVKFWICPEAPVTAEWSVVEMRGSVVY